MGAPGCHDQVRLPSDQVVHDRQIVWPEVPDDVDVVLEEPQIDPGRIVVVEGTQRPRLDQLLDLAHCPRKEKRVINHDLKIPAVGELDKFLGLL